MLVQKKNCQEEIQLYPLTSSIDILSGFISIIIMFPKTFMNFSVYHPRCANQTSDIDERTENNDPDCR